MSKWTLTSRTHTLKTGLFDYFKVGYRSDASGKAGMFDLLEMRNWVNVVPVTTDGHVLMVRQFRFGSGEVTLEFPAGAMDAGETPLETAQRELTEETGGQAREFALVGSCRPNPAFQNNICTHFAALGVEITQTQNLDPQEEIEVVRIPLDRVDDMVRSGEISHSLSIVSWYFYKQHVGAPFACPPSPDRDTQRGL